MERRQDGTKNVHEGCKTLVVGDTMEQGKSLPFRILFSLVAIRENLFLRIADGAVSCDSI